MPVTDDDLDFVARFLARRLTLLLLAAEKADAPDGITQPGRYAPTPLTKDERDDLS